MVLGPNFLRFQQLWRAEPRIPRHAFRILRVGAPGGGHF
jgi:hypothetical protein